VIVGGLVAALVISIILLPTLYAMFARSDDKLPEADPSEAV
jgi:Cu/Ag efflux pump CusA